MSRRKKILIAIIVVSFILTVISALAGMQFWVELLNPVTIFLIFLLLISNFKGLGPYKFSATFLGLAFLALVVGEGMHFANSYILHDAPYTFLIRLIYVMPGLFYALNETIYLGYKLRGRRRDLSHVYANTFCVALLGFLLIYRLFVSAVGSVNSPEQVCYLLSIFIAFYVCMMCLQTFYLIGWDQVFRATNIITFSMLLYELFDIRYIFVEAVGRVPDSNFVDIFYTFLIFWIAMGVTIQVERKYVFEFRPFKQTQKKIKNLSIISVCLIGVTVLLLFAGFFDAATATNIVIDLLAYLLMNYLLYVSELNEEHAKSLEEAVLQKTNELTETNRMLLLAKTEAEDASRAKSDFLANMTHEIRTPINTILGMDEMILRETADPTLRKYAINIQRAGKALLAQVNDVLDFSKIEAGKMELFPDEYDLALEVSDTALMINSRAATKGIDFIVDVDENIPRVLYGDNSRIRQVVINILSNAVKYTQEGAITLTLSYEKINDEEINLRVSVADTGIGIKEEDMHRLFMPFERIEENRNKTIEGTGLGMNIVRMLLDMMGSRLEAESEYGKGSKFSFTIRQKVVNWNPIGDYRRVVDELAAGDDRYHSSFTAPEADILLVDDTEMNLMVTKGLLRNTFVRIDTAVNGRQALSMTENKEYDVLLIDHRMPVMDGIEMIRALRADTSNKNSKKPCIALTANAVAGAWEEYMAAGFDDYLVKPVNSARMEEVLVKYIPAEKLNLHNTENARAILEADTTLSTIEEKGYLNIIDGIEYSGDVGMYREALKLFYRTIDSKIDEIRGYYDAADWDAYRVKVHALKSSAKIIGAEELSNKARALEIAVNEGDLDYIRDNTAGVLSFYGSYKEKLKIIET